jgi:4-hydroxymandelate oxidase
VSFAIVVATKTPSACLAMSPYQTLLNLNEFQAAAAHRLPRMVFDYFAGGTGDEITLRDAPEAWSDLGIRYRVLRGIAEHSTEVSILGHTLGFPVLVAPMAYQQLAHPDGEVAVARAAAAAGCGVVLSMLATTSVEDVRAAGTAPLWFQLYVYRDRELTRAVVQRAERAGCTALVLTADSLVLGHRERDARNRFHVPADLPVPNLTGDPRATLAGGDGSALAAFVAAQWDTTLAWPDVTWLRSITTLPILVKGVVRGDDARLALEHGAAGVIVSNHGGRQLDTSVSTVQALPEVAAAMDGRGALLVDGGIRRGTDVLKAIALGAHGVLLGRPVMWGLALGGADGATRVLTLLRSEFEQALVLAGCRSPAEITPDLIASGRHR